MKLKKTFKKVLSVVLALAMVVTSITVYNTTAKAAEWVLLNGLSQQDTTASILDEDGVWNSEQTGLLGFYKTSEGTNAEGWNKVSNGETLYRVPIFAFVTKGEKGDASNVVIKDESGNELTSTTATIQNVKAAGDCILIHQDVLKLEDGETEKTFDVVLTMNDGDHTVKVKIEREKAPSTDDVDTTEWTELPVRGDSNKIDKKYEINTADLTKLSDYSQETSIMGLSGVCAPHTASTYHENNVKDCGFAQDENAVIIYRKTQGVKTAWVDGIKYKSGEGKFTNGADTYEFSEELFDTDGIHYISLSGTNNVESFAIKVTSLTKYNVTVDGVINKIEANTEYNIGNAQYGYYDAKTGKIYKNIITVTEDIILTSINKIDVAYNKGASIRIDNTPGIRFQAIVDSDNITALASASVTTGTLITTVDTWLTVGGGEALKLDAIENVEEGKYPIHNVINDGWQTEENGKVTFCASIINISETNYSRVLMAKPYVTINYADGAESRTVYAGGVGVTSSPKQVASMILKEENSAYFESLALDEQKIIKAYAEITE